MSKGVLLTIVLVTWSTLNLVLASMRMCVGSISLKSHNDLGLYHLYPGKETGTERLNDLAEWHKWD